MAEVLLIIDGCNLILDDEGLKHQLQLDSPTHLAEGREWLKKRLKLMVKKTEIEIISVYDGVEEGEEKILAEGLINLFTSEEWEADDAIVEIIQEPDYAQIAVVTSDGGLRQRVQEKRGNVAFIWSSDFAEFLIDFGGYDVWFQTDPWLVLEILASRGIEGLKKERELCGMPESRGDFCCNVEIYLEGIHQRADQTGVEFKVSVEPENPNSAYINVIDQRPEAMAGAEYREKVTQLREAARSLEAAGNHEEDVERLSAEVEELSKEIKMPALEGRARMIYLAQDFDSDDPTRVFPRVLLKEADPDEPAVPLWLGHISPPTNHSRSPRIAPRWGTWVSPRWIGKSENTRYGFLVAGEGFTETTARDFETGEPGRRTAKFEEGKPTYDFRPHQAREELVKDGDEPTTMEAALREASEENNEEDPVSNGNNDKQRERRRRRNAVASQ